MTDLERQLQLAMENLEKLRANKDNRVALLIVGAKTNLTANAKLSKAIIMLAVDHLYKEIEELQRLIDEEENK